tara:strand:- start:52 stop:1632 length:1581 start_codon:yes stop_codon:yes gene_type:complete
MVDKTPKVTDTKVPQTHDEVTHELLKSIAKSMHGSNELTNEMLGLQLDMLTMTKEELADKLRKDRLEQSGEEEPPPPTDDPKFGAQVKSQISGLVGAMKGFVDENGGKVDLFKKVALAAAVAPFVLSFLDQTVDNVVDKLFGKKGSIKRSIGESVGSGVKGGLIGLAISKLFKQKGKKFGRIGFIGGLLYDVLEKGANLAQANIGDGKVDGSVSSIAASIGSAIGVVFSLAFWSKIFKTSADDVLKSATPALKQVIDNTKPGIGTGVKPFVAPEDTRKNGQGNKKHNMKAKELQAAMRALNETGKLPTGFSIAKNGRVMINTVGNFKGFASVAQIQEALGPEKTKKYAKVLGFLEKLPAGLMASVSVYDAVQAMKAGENDRAVIDPLARLIGGMVTATAVTAAGVAAAGSAGLSTPGSILLGMGGYMAGDYIGGQIAEALVTGNTNNLSDIYDQLTRPPGITDKSNSKVPMVPQGFDFSNPTGLNINAAGGDTNNVSSNVGGNTTINMVNNGSASLSNPAYLMPNQ